MNKTFKKSVIDKYLSNLKTKGGEEKINELVDNNATLIGRNDNYRMGPNYIKSKKTTDDFVRSATQGPEAYFIYGGPYYGINYTYTVSENEVLEDDDDDKKRFVDEGQMDEMKDLVDEIIRTKKEIPGIVKKNNERDLMRDTKIPNITILKKTYEKPMVVRKINHLLDLIQKEGLNGTEIAIVLNHLVDSLNIGQLKDEYKEIIGDKIKYSEK